MSALEMQQRIDELTQALSDANKMLAERLRKDTIAVDKANAANPLRAPFGNCTSSPLDEYAG